jgi:hypothetical protein
MSHVLTIHQSGVETIARVALARATDPARYQLCGVYLDFPVSRCVATDGKVLAVGKLNQQAIDDADKASAANEKPLLLPDAACKAIVKLYSWTGKACSLKRNVGRVWLRILPGENGKPRTVSLETLDNCQTFPESDGIYPDYSVAFPKLGITELDLDGSLFNDIDFSSFLQERF